MTSRERRARRGGKDYAQLDNEDLGTWHNTTHSPFEKLIMYRVGRPGDIGAALQTCLTNLIPTVEDLPTPRKREYTVGRKGKRRTGTNDSLAKGAAAGDRSGPCAWIYDVASGIASGCKACFLSGQNIKEGVGKYHFMLKCVSKILLKFYVKNVLQRIANMHAAADPYTHGTTDTSVSVASY